MGKGGAVWRSTPSIWQQNYPDQESTCRPWQWGAQELSADVPLSLAQMSGQWLQMLGDGTNAASDARCTFIFTLTSCWIAHSGRTVNVCAVTHCLQLLTEPDRRNFGLLTMMFYTIVSFQLCGLCLVFSCLSMKMILYVKSALWRKFSQFGVESQSDQHLLDELEQIDHQTRSPKSVLDLTDDLLAEWEQIPAAGPTSGGKSFLKTGSC